MPAAVPVQGRRGPRSSAGNREDCMDTSRGRGHRTGATQRMLADPDLGKIPDPDLAARHGCSTQTARYARRLRGLATVRRRSNAAAKTAKAPAKPITKPTPAAAKPSADVVSPKPASRVSLAARRTEAVAYART